MLGIFRVLFDVFVLIENSLKIFSAREFVKIKMDCKLYEPVISEVLQ